MLQLGKMSPLPVFIDVDAAIDHAHKEIISQGFGVRWWARTLIRKSIVLPIGSAVFKKDRDLKPQLNWWETTDSATAQQYDHLQKKKKSAISEHLRLTAMLDSRNPGLIFSLCVYCSCLMIYAQPTSVQGEMPERRCH